MKVDVARCPVDTLTHYIRQHARAEQGYAMTACDDHFPDLGQSFTRIPYDCPILEEAPTCMTCMAEPVKRRPLA